MSDIEIALVGKGCSLETTSIGRLSELLRIAQELISELAAELSSPAPMASLIRLRNKSAAYQLHSSDKHWRSTARRLTRALKERGKRESPRVRDRIRALYSLAGRDVRIRVTPVDKTGKTRGKELLVEPPATTDTPISFSATLYGRLVGLFERADRSLVVQLDRDDGGRVVLNADEAFFERATSLLRKPVRAAVVGSWDPETREESDWRLHALDAWTETDLVSTMKSVRDELDAKGLRLDVEAALRDLEVPS
jgi:hypothetical protein